jgi:hypothetical protein
MENNETSPSGRSPWPFIAGFFAVSVLIIVGLFLPPISLGERLGWGATTAEEAVIVATPTLGAESAALPEGVEVAVAGGAPVSVAAVAAAELAASADAAVAAAAAALPGDVTPAGAVYVLGAEGAGQNGRVSLPLPADAGAPQTLDVYGWDGSAWSHVPAQLDAAAGRITTLEAPLPRALMVAQTAAPAALETSLEIAPDGSLSEALRPLMGAASVGALALGANGEVTGDVAPAPEGAPNPLLGVTNAAGIVDQAALTVLLNDPALQQSQIAALVAKAREAGYRGLHLDYQGVPAAQKAAFTAFVTQLAGALDAEQMSLAVSLGTPAAAGGQWDTAGQDWAAIGKVADTVFVNMPLDPTAYTEGGLASQLLDFATDQIDRRKIVAQVSAGAVNKVGELFTELQADQVLGNFGKLQTASGETQVAPSTAVDVALDGSVSPLEWDGNSLAYKVTVDRDGQQQTIWLASEAALLNRLGLARDFNLRGVSLSGLSDLTSEAGLAAVLASVLGQGEAPQPSGAAIAWTVRDANGSVLASETGNDGAFTFAGAPDPGTYAVTAELVIGDQVAELGTLDLTVGDAAAEAEPTATREGEATPEATAAPDTAAAAATPQPTAPAANLPAGEATGQVAGPANVRVGPGLTYGTIAGGVNPGTAFKLIGRNADSSWLQVELPDGQKGWIFAQLVTVSQGFNVGSLAIAEAPAPPAAAGGGTTPPPAAAPVIPAPVGNVGNFELGGQAAGMPAGTMQYAGMKWVKKQHKWGPGDTPESVAGLINEAHANGLKILLSIPGQLFPSSIDFEAYTNFLGGVAALGPDAIEVWNEMNIDREWPAGQIDPASYVNNMLKPAYQKIKAANPNVMVIAGAPAPTGYFGGCSGAGCNDDLYVAGMMAAGAGGASDCIGVHYNEGLLPPSATSGDPRGSGGHYTRYFQGMINAYTAAGAPALCFTEIGYLSGQEWGSLPSGFLWKPPYNLTVAEHAQYLAEAVRVAVQSGRVRLMIVFNVDFKTFDSDPQAGYAMIRPDGGCPACETLRAVMGGG